MYRTTEVTIWHDPSIQKLSSDNKLLFFYLFTNSHSHLSGIYEITESTIAFETGLNIEIVRRGIDTLSMGYTCGIDGVNDENENWLILYDHKHQIVFVKNMLKYQARGEKIKKHLETHLSKFKKTFLINELIKMYPTWGIDTLSMGYTCGIDGVPYQRTENREQRTGSEDQQTCQKSKKNTAEHFEKFWSEYPRSEDKKTALSKWKAKRLDKIASQIIEDVRTRKERHRPWLDGFIPYASKYLNKELWNDAVNTQASANNRTSENVRPDDDIFS